MEAYQKFEQKWAEYLSWEPPDCVVACASGTAALHLALEALDLPRGSRVLVPNLTMIACARAITLAGLEPVLIDCGPDLLMDMRLAEVACSHLSDYKPRVRAVMPVHLYGRVVSHILVSNLAARYGLAVVEDWAEAHGGHLPNYTARGGHALCWSFYKNKIVAGEEGGAVAFRNSSHAERARCLRSLGFTPAHDFTHIPRGHNYRMSNVHATLIQSSLKLVRETLTWRRQTELRYNQFCPPQWRMPDREVVWVYDLRIPGMTSEKQTEVVDALRANGIEARHGFKPLHLQEEYVHCAAYGGDLAEQMSREVIYLPCTPGTVTLDTAREAFAVIHRTL